MEGIPLRGEQCKPGGHGGLEDAQEEADGHGAREVLGGGHAGEDEPPHDDVEGRPLGERQALEEAAGRVLEDEVAEVEHGADPRVVLAGEAEVWLKGEVSVAGQRIQDDSEGDTGGRGSEVKVTREQVGQMRQE